MHNDSPKDVLLQSRVIKNHIIDRCNTLRVDIELLAKKCGISKNVLATWINTPDVTLDIPQSVVVEMLSLLGVNVKVHLEVTPASELSEAQRAALLELRTVTNKNQQ